MLEKIVFTLFFRLPVILISLTVHELAHGWTARRLGDDTAQRAGRLTLNPLSHLDWFGAIMLMVGPFGWAKPVPVNPMNLRNPRKDMIWVSLAGPLANILLGYAAALAYVYVFQGSVQGYAKLFFLYFILINIGLSFFNLLPFPPLDGSNILRGFLSREMDARYLYATRIVPLIFIVLIGLEWMAHIPLLSYILDPLWKPYFGLLLDVYGVTALFTGAG
jgi:Zn-dependent protease